MQFIPQEQAVSRLLKAMADAANAPGRKIGLHDTVYSKLKGAILGLATSVANTRLHDPSLEIAGPLLNDDQKAAVQAMLPYAEVTLQNHLAFHGGNNHIGLGRDIDRVTTWRVAEATLRLPDQRPAVKAPPTKPAAPEGADGMPEGVEFEDGLEEHKEVMELDQQEELPPYMTEKDRNLLFTYTLEDSGALTTRVWAMAGTPELAKFLFGETAEPKQHTLIYDQAGSAGRFKFHRRFHLNLSEAMGIDSWTPQCTLFLISLMVTQQGILYHDEVLEDDVLKPTDRKSVV